MAEQPKLIRMSVVQAIDSSKATWIVIHNKVYDVTNFLEEVIYQLFSLVLFLNKIDFILLKMSSY